MGSQISLSPSVTHSRTAGDEGLKHVCKFIIHADIICLYGDTVNAQLHLYEYLLLTGKRLTSDSSEKRPNLSTLLPETGAAVQSTVMDPSRSESVAIAIETMDISTHATWCFLFGGSVQLSIGFKVNGCFLSSPASP